MCRRGPGQGARWSGDVGFQCALLIRLHLLLSPVASEDLLMVRWFCRRAVLVVGRLPAFGEAPLRSACNIRVIIIAGSRVKTDARGNRGCIIVLCGDGHGCDRVIVIDCIRGTLIRHWWA